MCNYQSSYITDSIEITMRWAGQNTPVSESQFRSFFEVLEFLILIWILIFFPSKDCPNLFKNLGVDKFGGSLWFFDGIFWIKELINCLKKFLVLMCSDKDWQATYLVKFCRFFVLRTSNGPAWLQVDSNLAFPVLGAPVQTMKWENKRQSSRLSLLL